MDQGRRSILKMVGAIAGACALPAHAFAEAGSQVTLATLLPMTGSGSQYGPSMSQAANLVVSEVNAAGGLLGHPVKLINADDQTSPEAAVRAVHQLIDIERVAGICGSWASSVTTAVAPLCWDSKTFIASCSGADSITALPHQGFLVRTQPSTRIQGRKFGEFAIDLGCKNIAFMSPQTPFAQSMTENIGASVKAAGAAFGSLIYEDKKNSYRSEVDKVLAQKPDMVILGGYVTDNTVVLKDLYRSGYNGKILGFAYGVNQKLIEALPAAVTDGIYSLAPSPAQNSTAYSHLAAALKVTSVDPYACQVYDQMNLMAMAIARAGTSGGLAIKDNIRAFSNPGGQAVTGAAQALPLIAQKRSVLYEGASGPCRFTESGDISTAFFRYEQIRDGRVALLKIA
ncbi:ABC transporter substrate-binding protein [Paraburkholderia nemoris]|uniref:Leucine-, isoleucine-, valine-, threonine-, and alanine-binding protein n=1 Tax=Paraburkholderia nemoris TaxID=2793076 RepID=A0ABM8SXT7_9BURK|nr:MULTISPECIES: ABC transporter substrate-binding protein [Paraburkholderia]MBK3815243.1 amino acid ABC transporter substrate-binding protein [Paraburkholderia aspalathi]CAE6714488.1 Leucine-, isoleucine-, valine-, threonine-, and alanine-binding protein [Paraburkholderia nemoris]CAE6840240.1 Leucine-, isoleucine-, valine-, threonine-, and alanine-binding protein [Paraburkholderia nemoris]